MDEPAFIAALRALASHPAARGLADDAAVLGDLVLTHDMVVEGIHYLPGDPPADVAWKLVAVNLSDLAAKGAVPLGVLVGYMLGDEAWDRAFLDGLGEALAAFAVPLLGGDTVKGSGVRALGLTALGRASIAPARAGARAGDGLWVVGTIGDAGLGLAIAQAGEGPPELLRAYRRPRPLLVEGRALAPHVHAMMDVSDGLLIDAARMAEASGLAVTIDLAAMPRSAAARAFAGDDRAARLAAATAGDDYALLFAASGEGVATSGVGAIRVGTFAEGRGVSLRDGAETVPLPARLGYQHG